MRFQGGDRAQKRITSPSDGHEIHSNINKRNCQFEWIIVTNLRLDQ